MKILLAFAALPAVLLVLLLGFYAVATLAHVNQARAAAIGVAFLYVALGGLIVWALLQLPRGSRTLLILVVADLLFAGVVGLYAIGSDTLLLDQLRHGELSSASRLTIISLCLTLFSLVGASCGVAALQMPAAVRASKTISR